MKNNAREKFKVPQVVSDLDVELGGLAMQLMPAYKDIPDEFKNEDTIWNRLVSDWFFSGISHLSLTPKEGIDKKMAIRHVRAIIGSFEPQHEHKEAACAYLLSLWFDNPKWDTVNEASLKKEQVTR